MSTTTTEPRLLTPTEIASLVKAMRAQMAWSQETLAELAGLTVRTVQRLEAGQAASFDTRRAISAAFGWPMDFFENPMVVPTVEELAKQKAAFDREHLILDAVSVDGRAIMTRMIDAPTYQGLLPCSLAQLPRDAQDAFAAVTDYIQDCMDVIGDVPRADALRYGDELSEIAEPLNQAGYQLHIAVRTTSVTNRLWVDKTPMPATILYVIAAPKGQLVQHIVVKKRVGM